MLPVLLFYLGLPAYLLLALWLLSWARKRHGNPNRAELLLWLIAFPLLLAVLEGLHFLDRRSNEAA